MKKSILVRAVLSAVATVLTVAISVGLTPATALMSANAALGQMAHSDASHVAAVAGMNIASLLANVPGGVLLLVLLLIWGSLFFNKNQ